MYQKKNVILDLSYQFSLEIIKINDHLENQKYFCIANQVLRSGTSIGANIREAQNAESKSDFIHKFKLAAKEAEETEYWLSLINDSKKLKIDPIIFSKIKELKAIINSIIATSKRDLKSNN
ncbi:MAG TPA: four helix bundle protein [Bacteroidales bacterium]|jgi:four helix bundle protein|nr:four helix bundle protein [Bacteroidales bacterium]HPS71289.1 four helix bundle protein [Bacteroidales bacterium]